MSGNVRAVHDNARFLKPYFRKVPILTHAQLYAFDTYSRVGGLVKAQRTPGWHNSALMPC
jgi:hypothetical protein